MPRPLAQVTRIELVRRGFSVPVARPRACMNAGLSRLPSLYEADVLAHIWWAGMELHHRCFLCGGFTVRCNRYYAYLPMLIRGNGLT